MSTTPTDSSISGGAPLRNSSSTDSLSFEKVEGKLDTHSTSVGAPAAEAKISSEFLTTAPTRPPRASDPTSTADTPLPGVKVADGKSAPLAGGTIDQKATARSVASTETATPTPKGKGKGSSSPQGTVGSNPHGMALRAASDKLAKLEAVRSRPTNIQAEITAIDAEMAQLEEVVSGARGSANTFRGFVDAKVDTLRTLKEQEMKLTSLRADPGARLKTIEAELRAPYEASITDLKETIASVKKDLAIFKSMSKQAKNLPAEERKKLKGKIADKRQLLKASQKTLDAQEKELKKLPKRAQEQYHQEGQELQDLRAKYQKTKSSTESTFGTQRSSEANIQSSEQALAACRAKLEDAQKRYTEAVSVSQASDVDGQIAAIESEMRAYRADLEEDIAKLREANPSPLPFPTTPEQVYICFLLGEVPAKPTEVSKEAYDDMMKQLADHCIKEGVPAPKIHSGVGSGDGYSIHSALGTPLFYFKPTLASIGMPHNSDPDNRTQESRLDDLGRRAFANGSDPYREYMASVIAGDAIPQCTLYTPDFQSSVFPDEGVGEGSLQVFQQHLTILGDMERRFKTDKAKSTGNTNASSSSAAAMSPMDTLSAAARDAVAESPLSRSYGEPIKPHQSNLFMSQVNWQQQLECAYLTFLLPNTDGGEANMMITEVRDIPETQRVQMRRYLTKEEPVLGDDGKPVLDKDGEPETKRKIIDGPLTTMHVPARFEIKPFDFGATFPDRWDRFNNPVFSQNSMGEVALSDPCMAWLRERAAALNPEDTIAQVRSLDLDLQSGDGVHGDDALEDITRTSQYLLQIGCEEGLTLNQCILPFTQKILFEGQQDLMGTEAQALCARAKERAGGDPTKFKEALRQVWKERREG